MIVHYPPPRFSEARGFSFVFSLGFLYRICDIDIEFKQAKEKLEALLELSHNHQSSCSGSVGNPKSS